jgi:integrase
MQKPGRPPFRPTRFVVYPVGTAGATRRSGKTVKCWDVRGQIDDGQFFRRFTAPDGTAELAKRYAKQLAADYEAGLLWDPQAKRFVAADVATADTVWSWTRRYWSLMVSEWEPATRASAARAMRRACTQLLLPGAPEMLPTVATGLSVAFLPTPGDTGDADAWFALWSRPLRAVTHEHLEELLAAYRVRDDGRPVSPATERRMVADLRQCWQLAHSRGLTDRDPWPAVRILRKTKSAGTVEKVVRGVQAVDADVVLSPAQVWKLADAVAATTANAGRYRAYVLLMGLCGLRPSEALGLTVSDLELPDAATVATGWVRVRRSKRTVSKTWVTGDEDATFGPLKGRGTDEERRAPIPSTLVPVLREHLQLYRADASPGDLLFVGPRGGPVDLNRFDRDHWRKARRTEFGTDGPLARLHRHDLRHAACSAWLAAGVPLKVATGWSGHRTVSVFLDVYQGVMPGSEDAGVTAYEQYLAAQ